MEGESQADDDAQ